MTVVLQTELVFRIPALWADIAAAGLVDRGGADVGIARMNSSIADLRPRAQSVKHTLADSTIDDWLRRGFLAGEGRGVGSVGSAPHPQASSYCARGCRKLTLPLRLVV